MAMFSKLRNFPPAVWIVILLCCLEFTWQVWATRYGATSIPGNPVLWLIPALKVIFLVLRQAWVKWLFTWSTIGATLGLGLGVAVASTEVLVHLAFGTPVSPELIGTVAMVGCIIAALFSNVVVWQYFDGASTSASWQSFLHLWHPILTGREGAEVPLPPPPGTVYVQDDYPAHWSRVALSLLAIALLAGNFLIHPLFLGLTFGAVIFIVTIPFAILPMFGLFCCIKGVLRYALDSGANLRRPIGIGMWVLIAYWFCWPVFSGSLNEAMAELAAPYEGPRFLWPALMPNTIVMYMNLLFLFVVVQMLFWSKRLYHRSVCIVAKETFHPDMPSRTHMDVERFHKASKCALLAYAVFMVPVLPAIEATLFFLSGGALYR